jgi:transcriptional regulator with XRE-family HTH domain
MATRRDGLARRRAAMGFTQETLAERLGFERSTVGRWERGTGTPQPWNQPDLAKALGLSHDVLVDLLEPDHLPDAGHAPGRLDARDVARSLVDEFNWPDWHRTGQASVLEPPWSVTGTTQVLHEIAGGGMDRRGFLTITGGALVGLAGHWGAALANTPTALPEDHQRHWPAAILDRIDSRLTELRRLDDALGGRDLCQLAAAEFQYLTNLADRDSYRGAARQRLFGLITDAAGLCGWVHFDATRHAAAQSYYVAALRSSAVAGDALAGAHVLGRMSHQATVTGHHQEAVALLDAAEQQIKRSATPRAKARFASGKAHAYAKAGDARACGRALNDAEHWLDRATPGTEEPDWLYYFNEAELAYTAAACWVDLQHPANARPLIDAALTGVQPDYVRDRAVFHVSSAEAHLHAGDLEPACSELETAAGLVVQTGSTRTVEMIRTARGGMSRYDREPRVRKLDRLLGDLAA